MIFNAHWRWGWFSPPSFSSPARESRPSLPSHPSGGGRRGKKTTWIPAFGENDGRGGTGRKTTWIPAFGENDGGGSGGEGEGSLSVSRIFSPPSFSSLARESRPPLSVSCLSFSVILGASPGIQAAIVGVVRVFLPSVILEPCSGIQAAIVGVVRVFLPSVILGASPGIQVFSGKQRAWIPTFGENDGGRGWPTMGGLNGPLGGGRPPPAPSNDSRGGKGSFPMSSVGALCVSG